MTLKYQNQLVLVNLLDNPFVQKWAVHLKQILGTYQHEQFYSSYPFIRTTNQDQVYEHATHLQDAVAQLKQLNVGFPGNFDKAQLKSLDLELQQTLNQLHRYFTWCNRDDIGKNKFWEADCPVTGSQDRETQRKINELTHRINIEVHKIEAYVTTPHKVALKANSYTELLVEFDTQPNPTISSEMVPNAWNYIQPEDFQYLSNDPKYDLWLPNQILGKPYNIAFYDHDNPNEWDVTHPIGYSGNFVVGVVGNKAQHMTEPMFVEWLRSHGIEPGPTTCGMPLGQIVSGREYLNQWRKDTTNGKLIGMTIELDLL